MVRWQCRWGADTAFLESLAEVDGVLPGALAERPVLFPALAVYWRAFVELRHDRAASDQGIPWTALDAHAARAGIEDPDEFALFVRLLRACDQAYLEARAEAVRAAAGPPKPL